MPFNEKRKQKNGRTNTLLTTAATAAAVAVTAILELNIIFAFCWPSFLPFCCYLSTIILYIYIWIFYATKFHLSSSLWGCTTIADTVIYIYIIYMWTYSIDIYMYISSRFSSCSSLRLYGLHWIYFNFNRKWHTCLSICCTYHSSIWNCYMNIEYMMYIWAY